MDIYQKEVLIISKSTKTTSLVLIKGISKEVDLSFSC